MNTTDYTDKKKHHRLFLILVSGFWFLVSGIAYAQQVRGIWVECEGTNETPSSPKKLEEMIQIAKDTGINTIFLQVYRHGRSWYSSSLADTGPFKNIQTKYGIDPLSYTIKEAHKYGIKVHAWINIFRIGKNLDIPIVQKLGKDIITRDGHGKSLLKYPLNKLPDGGYWLDPGDTGVLEYLLKLVSEVLQRYPQLDGIHLDFIRYPYIELTPGAQFSEHKDFGYGKVSVERFMAKYGYSPLGMDLSNRVLTQQWDDWRREQLSGFVGEVYKLTKNLNPQIQVSCAVQPWTDRAYLVAYQDWRNWLNSNTVDFVVIMNYSIDRKIVKYLSETAVYIRGSAPAYIGLGAYLLAKSPNALYLQIKDCQKLWVKGIVLFSYDALLKDKDIFKTISKNKWWSK